MKLRVWRLAWRCWPVRRFASANGSPDDFAYPTYPGPPSYEYQTRLLFPPEAGPSYGYPTNGYPNGSRFGELAAWSRACCRAIQLSLGQFYVDG